MMRFRHVVGALAMVALAGSLAMAQAPAGGGQRGAAPPEPHNLKVLPASTTTAQILPTMRAFAAALGTNCGYCHVWTGPGLPTGLYALRACTTAAVAGGTNTAAGRRAAGTRVSNSSR